MKDKKIIAWDWLPQDWTGDEHFFQYDHWFENEAMQEGHVKEEHDHVIGPVQTSFWLSMDMRERDIYTKQQLRITIQLSCSAISDWNAYFSAIF